MRVIPDGPSPAKHTSAIHRALLSVALTLLALRTSPALADGPITYAKQIAPIIQRACQPCHRPGQSAPMSLVDFASTRPWGKAIRRVTGARTMPPWFADPRYGKFKDNPTLTDDEIATIAAWVDQGAPLGDPAGLPPPLTFKSEWTLDPPDQIITMPEAHALAAEGEDQFAYYEIPTGVTEDRWLRSIELRPSDARAVHHAMVYLIQDEGSDDEWSRIVGVKANLISEYAAGNAGDLYPEGTGRLIKPNGRFLVQIHYHPFGEATHDRLQLGLVFHPKGTQCRPIISRPIHNFELRIPAGESHHEHIADLTLARPARLLSFQPHMHFRGRSMMLEAFYPDGRNEILCSVPNYDPNWQISYRYETPPLLPPGTRLHLTSVFDNSAANPHNPNPNIEVKWGPYAFDEMGIGWIDFLYDDQEG